MDRSAFVQRLNRTNLPIYLVVLFSIGYLTWLAFSIHDGIFYAGDQGLKYLQARQIGAGYGFKYLHLVQPEWVQAVWNAGYSPMRPPFFYPSSNGYIFVYPPAFQIISSLFYSHWGLPGLYIIPMLCTLVLFLWLVFLLKRIGVKPLMIALALFLLVFCSPLALYGLMFWEHLPAVLLLFSGLAFIVSAPSATGTAVVMGIVSGLAVWLRPEALMMNFLYALAILVLYFRERRSVYPGFLVGLALAVIPFFIFNQIEYGSILGMHGQQLMEDNSINSNMETRMGLQHGLVNLKENNDISTRHFLLVLLLIPIIYLLVRKKDWADLRPALLTGIVVLFSLVTPFLLPNSGVIQWGARYFLAIIPVTLVTLFLVEKQWNLFEGRKIPVWLLVLIVAGTLQSFYLNTHGGGYKELRWRYNQRLAAADNLIKKDTGNVVIMSNSWMVNDFANLFDNHYFFTASGNDSLRRLLPLLKKNGVHQYIYLFNPRTPTLPTMLKDSTTSHWWVKRPDDPWIKDDYEAKVYTIE